MKKFTESKTIIIGALIALLIVSLMMIITDDHNDDYKQVDNQTKAVDSATKNTTDTQSEFKKQYIKGCVEEGEEEMREYCECTYNYLVENYSKRRIMELGLKLMENEKDGAPKEMKEAAKACISEIKI